MDQTKYWNSTVNLKRLHVPAFENNKETTIILSSNRRSADTQPSKFSAMTDNQQFANESRTKSEILSVEMEHTTGEWSLSLLSNSNNPMLANMKLPKLRQVKLPVSLTLPYPFAFQVGSLIYRVPCLFMFFRRHKGDMRLANVFEQGSIDPSGVQANCQLEIEPIRMDYGTHDDGGNNSDSANSSVNDKNSSAQLTNGDDGNIFSSLNQFLSRSPDRVSRKSTVPQTILKQTPTTPKKSTIPVSAVTQSDGAVVLKRLRHTPDLCITTVPPSSAKVNSSITVTAMTNSNRPSVVQETKQLRTPNNSSTSCKLKHLLRQRSELTPNDCLTNNNKKLTKINHRPSTLAKITESTTIAEPLLDSVVRQTTSAAKRKLASASKAGGIVRPSAPIQQMTPSPSLPTRHTSPVPAKTSYTWPVDVNESVIHKRPHYPLSQSTSNLSDFSASSQNLPLPPPPPPPASHTSPPSRPVLQSMRLDLTPLQSPAANTPVSMRKLVAMQNLKLALLASKMDKSRPVINRISTESPNVHTFTFHFDSSAVSRAAPYTLHAAPTSVPLDRPAAVAKQTTASDNLVAAHHRISTALHSSLPLQPSVIQSTNVADSVPQVGSQRYEENWNDILMFIEEDLKAPSLVAMPTEYQYMTKTTTTENMAIDGCTSAMSFQRCDKKKCDFCKIRRVNKNDSTAMEPIEMRKIAEIKLDLLQSSLTFMHCGSDALRSRAVHGRPSKKLVGTGGPAKVSKRQSKPVKKVKEPMPLEHPATGDTLLKQMLERSSQPPAMRLILPPRVQQHKHLPMPPHQRTAPPDHTVVANIAPRFSNTF